ncbi:hypothetical protein HYH03_002242 [Edaphochlamys debaryana]|uniref:Uncharacterized protein n=1 Tax=Edaphochlamys debaryana TaxID=47281 RepID=A0A835YE50_9CHLO|nr:hypothetical protein HYH03_002242 [Edaphochlamys debaryana]|eukprot:KAG2499957.1 hypothetical protein HYH03_002242 [Edaphochlamys debaryana]
MGGIGMLLGRELTPMIASTSGRSGLGEAMARAAPALQAVLGRGFASLVDTGVPAPRPDVALYLSSPHGGHINRLINSVDSVVELDAVLYKFRKRLRPANIGCAAMKLEALHRHERTAPTALKLQRVAAEVARVADTYAERLALTQIANVVRGLSSCRHRLPPGLLVRLAAGALADGGGALSRAPDVDARDLAYGFAGQGYTNQLFWSRLSSALLPRLRSFDPNTLPALVSALHAAHQLPAGRIPPPASPASPASSASSLAPASPSAPPAGTPQAALAAQALALLASDPGRLQPARLADAAQLLALLGPAVLGPGALDGALAEKLTAAAMQALPGLPGPQVPDLLLSLLSLRRAATGATEALPAELVAAALPHLRAAAPQLSLLDVKRAVEALAPSAAAPGGAASKPLAAVLELLARRAAAVLPAANAADPAAPALRLPLRRVPAGGAGAGLVLAAAAPPPALNAGSLGVLDGLARAFAAAAGAAAPSGPAVKALFGRVAELAAEARRRGLLAEAQRQSLGQSLAALAGQEAAAPLLTA